MSAIPPIISHVVNGLFSWLPCWCIHTAEPWKHMWCRYKTFFQMTQCFRVVQTVTIHLHVHIQTVCIFVTILLYGRHYAIFFLCALLLLDKEQHKCAVTRGNKCMQKNVLSNIYTTESDMVAICNVSETVLFLFLYPCPPALCVGLCGLPCVSVSVVALWLTDDLFTLSFCLPHSACWEMCRKKRVYLDRSPLINTSRDIFFLFKYQHKHREMSFFLYIFFSCQQWY